MQKGQQKLYQKITPKELIKQLEKINNALYGILGIKTKAITGAIEYIYLNERKEKNEHLL